MARNVHHFGAGWGRCCVRLQTSDSYSGFCGGTLLVCLVGLPFLASFGAQGRVREGYRYSVSLGLRFDLDDFVIDVHASNLRTLGKTHSARDRLPQGEGQLVIPYAE